ncbi:hypothetical protein [Tabrizicola sp.]|uniref:HNH endonuclease n=1 Tax=Tabrizicola sp. TaxID=2005166 RepID=UPI002603C5D5|nr:hypothetical protein [Tabrizicola sp.]MDM7932903.1 hypothetical protein [Tabrizicola sp.]
MRRVDRNAVSVPASLIRPEAQKEFDAARRVVALRAERLRLHDKAVETATALGQTAPKLPQASGEEAAFAFKLYKSADIRLALEALFHGKCAYCETRYAHQAPVDIEHYRPKGAVEGDKAHPGYWWLAAAWENLVPSCIDCNRRRTQTLSVPATATFADLLATLLHGQSQAPALAGKKDSFPVAGQRAHSDRDSLSAEQPYLLDPTADEPDDHLDYYLDHTRDGVAPLALILPRLRPPGDPDRHPETPDGEAGPSVRGLMTIQFCGLNRLALVQERTALLRRLEFLRDAMFQIDTAARDLHDSVALAAPELADKLAGTARLLDSLASGVLHEILAALDPDQPYATLARRWLERWADTLNVNPDPTP